MPPVTLVPALVPALLGNLKQRQSRVLRLEAPCQRRPGGLVQSLLVFTGKQEKRRSQAPGPPALSHLLGGLVSLGNQVPPLLGVGQHLPALVLATGILSAKVLTGLVRYMKPYTGCHVTGLLAHLGRARHRR